MYMMRKYLLASLLHTGAYLAHFNYNRPRDRCNTMIFVVIITNAAKNCVYVATALCIDDNVECCDRSVAKLESEIWKGNGRRLVRASGDID